MSERIVLDPVELGGSGRTEFDLTDWIDMEGADWGEATIEPFLADKERGSIPVDFRLPNRTVTIPLNLVNRGGTTAISARASIQAKAAIFQREGGFLKRVTNSGGTVFADVVDAAFTATSIPGYASRQDIDLGASLTLTVLPDFYEAERSLGDHVETTNPELTFIEIGDIVRTNESTNPKGGPAGGLTIANWSSGSSTSFTALTLGQGGAPAPTAEMNALGLTTGFKATGDSDGDALFHGISSLDTGDWALSLYLYIADLGGATSVTVQFTDLTDEYTEVAETTVGSWVKIDLQQNFTTLAAVWTTFSLHCWIKQVGAGAAEWYFTGLLMEKSSSVGTYFDGDSEPAQWTGSSGLSSSQLGSGLDGDYPARVRVVVDDDQGQNQRGLLWGFRSRYHDSANTAALAYQAESLTPLGGAAKKATTGASGGTAVGGTLWPVYTPLLSTEMAGTTYLTHKGSYRAWARCWCRGTVATSIRLKYDVNDLVNPVVNDAWTMPSPGAGTTAGSAFFMADLGEVRLDPSPVGTHRWSGQLDAKTTAGTARFRVDRLDFQPIDEGCGRLTAPMVAGAANQTLQAFDDFSTHVVGGTLSALAAPKGGNWDEAGDTTDFTISAVVSGALAHFSVRSALSDADLNTGQYVVLDGSSSLAGVEVQADVSQPGHAVVGKEIRGGVVARYVDTNNWLMAVQRQVKTMVGAAGVMTRVALLKRVGGTVTTLGDVLRSNVHSSGAVRIKLTVDASGNASVFVGLPGSDLGAAVISVNADANLATGGALDDGKVGMYDATDLTSGTYDRYYGNFQTLTGETPDSAVIFASQSAQLTTDGHYRLDVGGTAYGPVAIQSGDLPRLPVAGLENRTTEIFLKGSRGDFDALPDSGIDDISARVFYSPSWLVVPDT